MNFKIWLEDIEAKRAGIKSVILNFLKEKMNINDDDEVLSMPLKAITGSVITDLINRGLINTADDYIIQNIKNGSGTVLDLIDDLSGVGSRNTFPDLSNEGVPADWEPSPRMMNNSFDSALRKISKNKGEMPFNGNFADANVIQIRFKLDNEELAAIKHAGLLIRGEYGWNIDQNKFHKYYQDMLGRRFV